MFHTLDLSIASRGRLQEELTSGFTNKADSLGRIRLLLETLGDKSRTDRLSLQTKQQRLSLRLFLLAKQHYFHTDDPSLVVALLENRLTEKHTAQFVRIAYGQRERELNTKLEDEIKRKKRTNNTKRAIKKNKAHQQAFKAEIEALQQAVNAHYHSGMLMARHENGALTHANSKETSVFAPPGIPGQPRTADTVARAEAQIRLMRRGADPARGPALTTAQLAGLPRETLSQEHVKAIDALLAEAGTSEALPSNPLQHFGFCWWRQPHAHEPCFSLERLNLSGVTLAGADLRGANIKGVDFTRCKLLRPVIDRWMQWGDTLTAENWHILWPLVGVARTVRGTQESLYTVRPDTRVTQQTSTDATGHTHALSRTQEHSAILTIPPKHRQAFAAAQHTDQILAALNAYLGHPLADAEGLTTLPPHLAIFPTGSTPHQDMQQAIINRYLLACIREGKPLPVTPPNGMTPEQYAEYQAIVQHTEDAPDDVIAQWVRYPLTPTTIIDALLAIKDGPWSLNNIIYLLRYPTLAFYEKMESFALLFACSAVANAGLTPAVLAAFTVSNPLLALPTLAILAFSLRNGIMPLAKAAITLASFGWAGDKLAQSPMIVDFINTHGTTLTVLAKILPISTWHMHREGCGRRRRTEPTSNPSSTTRLY